MFNNRTILPYILYVFLVLPYSFTYFELCLPYIDFFTVFALNLIDRPFFFVVTAYSLFLFCFLFLFNFPLQFFPFFSINVKSLPSQYCFYPFVCLPMLVMPCQFFLFSSSFPSSFFTYPFLFNCAHSFFFNDFSLFSCVVNFPIFFPSF
jgi:hypothetical protein